MVFSCYKVLRKYISLMLTSEREKLNGLNIQLQKLRTQKSIPKESKEC